MSQTACWATNRLDVEIAELSFGYGSIYDMTTERHLYHVSLEGAKCLARYDDDYVRYILFNCDDLRDPFSPKDREDINKLLYSADETPETRQKLLEYIRKLDPDSLSGWASVGIHFPHLSKDENKKKQTEWFQEMLLESGKYGIPRFHIEYRSPNGNCCVDEGMPLKIVNVPAPSSYPDYEMFNRIQFMYRMVNYGDHGFWTSWNRKSTETYLCTNFDEQTKMEQREWWWTYQFEELKYPGPITTDTEDDILKMIELATNYKHNDYYSWTLDRDCPEIHWLSVENKWSMDDIKKWFETHSAHGHQYNHILDVYRYEDGQLLEVHLDDRNDGMGHNLGHKIIFDKRKIYTTWTGEHWWDWYLKKEK